MEITNRQIDNCDLVIISGRIDSYSSPSLLEKLLEITNQQRYKIIMEMANVVFVSSAGLRVLIDVQKTCKKINQGEIILVNTPQRVFDTLELAGFAPLFKFASDIPSAINAF